MNKGTVKLLEKHFDITFAAPDGIKKLRELILTLAMQGKLVEQDPQDQPARKLLQEIEAEKRRLVKEGKIKNPKPLPEIKADEVPYQLPEGWEWVRLRDICHDWGQKKPDERFTYIDVGSIDNKNGIIGETVQLLDSSEAPSRARKLVRKGTVIYSTVRPYLLNIAIIEKEYQQEPIASTAFAILHPYIGITNRFIYHYLHSPVFVYYVESTMKGVAYPAINDGDFFKGVFPLPPLPEQLRIVARIDQLMARCDELAKLRAEHEQKRLAVHTAALNRLLASKERDSFADAWLFITRHFGQLYSVKENVAELRKTILQLAVMGKLVPQDPNDPPASKLLEEIEAEKHRLVQEKKIKKPKPLPEIKPEEVPYALPQGWEWVRFGDITLNRDGERIPVSKDEREKVKGNYDYYGASGVIDKVNDYIFDKDLLLIGEDGANLVNRSTPIAFIARGKYWVNNHAHVLDATVFDLLLYLDKYINAIDLKPYVTGTAQPKMNQAKMNSIVIAAPQQNLWVVFGSGKSPIV